MKLVLKFPIIVVVGFLMACGGNKSNNPAPRYPTTTDMGTTKTVRNIVVNNISITYKGNVPNVFELTNHAGTDIIFTVAATGAEIELQNQFVGSGNSSQSTANGSTIIYSNIINSTNDRLNTDTIAQKYAANNVYVNIRLDKSAYGYDEVHAFINNDNTLNAGLVNIIGNSQVTTSNIQEVFTQSKVAITKFDIE